MAVSPRDREILRSLAKEIREASEKPVQKEREAMWYAHNALDQSVRPLVFCDPENGWHEIVPESALACEGDEARRFEWQLRVRVFWTKMKHDRIDTADWFVSRVYRNTGWGLSPKTRRTSERGAFRWDPPIKDYAEDMKKLHFPEITVDDKKSAEALDQACELFGDILNVSQKNSWWWTLGLTQDFVMLRGLEQMMYDMYDEPEGVHALMGFLRDGTLKMLDFLEDNALLPPNFENWYVGSGGFGLTHELPKPGYDGRVRLKDMWGFCESQETVDISPAMFEEFIFPYQLPIMERFGLNCYGCCEPLNTRWDVVKRFPNLRRVSCSAWADHEKMAEYLGGNYVYSFKPNPAYLAKPEIDEAEIRAYLRPVIKTCREHGCVLEMVMKDNHTIGNNPENVLRWCEIASDEAER